MLIASVSFALCGIGSAFNLDFSSVTTGTTVPGTLTINVPGYGDVAINTNGASSVVVDSNYAPKSLEFDTGESITITFLGATPTGVSISTSGMSAGEAMNLTYGANANEYLVQLSGAAIIPGEEGAGLSGINFGAVPEPSAALLGALGAAMLVIRRRR